MSSSSLSASSLFNVQGKVALVTGGGSGIGLMAVQALATNGAKVYITGRRKAKLEETVAANKGLAGEIVAVEGDVTSKESLVRVREAIVEGHLDILINNAGVEGPVTKLGEDVEAMTGKELSEKHLQNETFDQWNDLFQINTHAVFFATMTLLPLLEASVRKGRDASVTNITSISASVKYSQNHYGYNASKAAANSLTLMLAHELNYRSKLNIRVNALAPGLFASEMTEKMLEEGKQRGNKPPPKGTENPAGRTGTAEEMASGILFLATNSFTTGQILAVDGGFVTAVPGTR